MKWLSIKEHGLPDCWSQHGNCFASGYLLTLDINDEWYENQYWIIGKHTNNGYVREKEEWEKNDYEITHYMYIKLPNKI